MLRSSEVGSKPHVLQRLVGTAGLLSQGCQRPFRFVVADAKALVGRHELVDALGILVEPLTGRLDGLLDAVLGLDILGAEHAHGGTNASNSSATSNHLGRELAARSDHFINALRDAA